MGPPGEEKKRVWAVSRFLQREGQGIGKREAISYFLPLGKKKELQADYPDRPNGFE